MQLLHHQQNMDVLRHLAAEGVYLLATRQFESFVARYGYALSYGRDPVDAVRIDLVSALSGAPENELLQISLHDLPVVAYRVDSPFILAVIECDVPTRAGRNICVSFVVTATESGQFLTLEDICAQHTFSEPESHGNPPAK